MEFNFGATIFGAIEFYRTTMPCQPGIGRGFDFWSNAMLLMMMILLPCMHVCTEEDDDDAQKVIPFLRDMNYWSCFVRSKHVLGCGFNSSPNMTNTRYDYGPRRRVYLSATSPADERVNVPPFAHQAVCHNRRSNLLSLSPLLLIYPHISRPKRIRWSSSSASGLGNSSSYTYWWLDKSFARSEVFSSLESKVLLRLAAAVALFFGGFISTPHILDRYWSSLLSKIVLLGEQKTIRWWMSMNGFQQLMIWTKTIPGYGITIMVMIYSVPPLFSSKNHSLKSTRRFYFQRKNPILGSCQCGANDDQAGQIEKRISALFFAECHSEWRVTRYLLSSPYLHILITPCKFITNYKIL